MLSLALFARGQAMAAERGLILADTKYEFGKDAEGRILLADEIHTPDSSRFWRAASYESRFAAEERPESFDKDFVRSWVAARCDPYHDEIPPIPASLILATSAVYIEAFETITGQSFILPDPAGISWRACAGIWQACERDFGYSWQIVSALRARSKSSTALSRSLEGPFP